MMAIGPIIPKEKIVVESQGASIIKVEPPQVDYEKKKKIIRYKQILWYVLLTLEALLGIRFLLKLFGANPLNIFTILITILSTPFTILFYGVFPSTTSLVGNAVVEWSTLFAMLVYAIIVFVASFFIRLKEPIDPEEANKKVDEPLP